MKSPDDERFICRDVIATRIGDGKTIVQTSDGGGRSLLPNAVALALLGCQRLDTLAGHASQAIRRLDLPASLQPVLEHELALCARAGLLAGWKELAREPLAQPTAKLRALGIVTRDRPHALARALRSHFLHAQRFGRNLHAVVVDSSRTKTTAAETHSAALAIGRQFDSSVRYLHAHDHIRYANRLAARAGLNPEVVLFGLTDLFDCGHDTGSNRNALMLAQAGQAFLSSDDDVVCEPRRAPASGQSLRIASGPTPTRVRLFQSAQDAEAAFPVADACLFSAHEALLGRSANSLLAGRAASEVTIDQLNSSVRGAILDGRARVVITASGIVGDCAAKFPAFYLWEPEVRRQLKNADLETYRSLVESRQISRTAPTPTIVSSPLIMSTHLAFAGDTFLPPFFPVLRGQDLSFGRRLHLTTEGNMIGHVPLGIRHAPMEERRASLDQIWDQSTMPSFAFVLESCLKAAAEGSRHASPGSARLRLVGRNLYEMASLAMPEFNIQLRQALFDSIQIQMLRWEAMIASDGATSSLWLNDLRRRRQYAVDRLLEQNELAASELVPLHGVAKAREATQRLLRRFGELLECWPFIVDAAKDLEAEGHGIFSQVDTHLIKAANNASELPHRSRTA
jgi:hypothetical protein